MHRYVLPLCLLPLVSALNFDCDLIRVDKTSFDLSKLKGPHTVSRLVSHPPSVSNTTFTLDLCAPLTGEDLGRGLKKTEQCPTGTRVCAVERDRNEEEDVEVVTKVIPIAGEFAASHGRGLEPKVTRLRNSASNGDSGKEGVRVEFNGGKYPNTRGGRVQRAVVELVCDKERTGLEQMAWREGMVLRREDGEGEGDKKEEEEEGKGSLRFVSYKEEGEDMDVLRLDWRTKYACEDVPKEEGANGTSGWGFFTWLFVVVFLGAAAYIIFGSWLNYTRYGARGWDLVPHGDSIRDLPYILKDWAKSVIDTVQGRGYRGGYSAV
ncbi:Autophagy-related protein 27 [Sphaceloma murrayae]|uniref:Autophagy-related protein 27 n=1 Tax=Sphaceloma murrayae TaxID=2082308 RepID=A0A2K1QT36_9PEZI|nr:Autophagy-related protein 27 [Sphaceloma murrayae]